MQNTDNHNLQILQIYFNDFKIYESESQKTQTINYEFNLRFPGQYYDKEIKTNYNLFRDYNSSLGRYVQSDPIGLSGGLNSYAYAGQNSFSYFDINGLAQCTLKFYLNKENFDGILTCISDIDNKMLELRAAAGNNIGIKCKNNPSIECQRLSARGPLPAGYWKIDHMKVTGATQNANGIVLEPFKKRTDLWKKFNENTSL